LPDVSYPLLKAAFKSLRLNISPGHLIKGASPYPVGSEKAHAVPKMQTSPEAAMSAKSGVRAGESVKAIDPIWDSIRLEAERSIAQDPLLASFLYSTVLNQPSLEEAVIHRVCERLDHQDLQANILRQTFLEMVSDWREWGSVLRVDIQAVYDRDPACTRFIQPVLYFKGFHAIQTHRLAHWLWGTGAG
jgi:serine O-acetyltransferase